jgi:hypothetical protein
MKKLENCPFCNDVYMLTEPNGHESYVHCQDCGADGPLASYDKCEELWNNRHQIKIKMTNAFLLRVGIYYWSVWCY